jgi:hypothetical protein
MKRAAITSVAVVGAFLLCGLMYPNHASRLNSYRRPSSAHAAWGRA